MTALAQLFASGFLLSLSLCLDLGVVNVALVRTGLTRGTSAALLLGLGSCIGDLVYAVSSLSLVALLLAHRQIRIALWLGGSAVLLWLALKMLRESRAARPLAVEGSAGTVSAGAAEAASASVGADGAEAARPGKLAGPHDFLRGMLLALSSPSAILWFAAVGGSVIAAHAHDGAALAPFLAGFFAAGVCWSIAMAVVSGYAHRRMSSGFVRALALVSAILFAYFALVVFIRGYREFV